MDMCSYSSNYVKSVFQGGFKPVSLSKLMSVCQEHIQEMTEGVHLIRSSSPRINDLTSVLNLTEEEAKANPKFHLEWYVPSPELRCLCLNTLTLEQLYAVCVLPGLHTFASLLRFYIIKIC